MDELTKLRAAIRVKLEQFARWHSFEQGKPKWLGWSGRKPRSLTDALVQTLTPKYNEKMIRNFVKENPNLIKKWYSSYAGT